MQPKNKNDSVQLPTRYQQYDFAKQHLRGASRPEVFPLRKDCEADNVVPTLTARYSGAQSTGAYLRQLTPKGRIRRLTPTECERLQGFPDGWTEGISDTQRYKCLGNAVTVNVVRAIIERLI